MEFVCNKNIEFTSPELQSKICQARLEWAHIQARRTGNVKDMDRSDSVPKPPKTKKRRKEATDEPPPVKKTKPIYDDVSMAFFI